MEEGEATIDQNIHGSTGTVLLNEMTRNASIENDAQLENIKEQVDSHSAND